MGKTLKELSTSVNGGYALEAILAMRWHCKRDGKNGGAPDLVKNGKGFEVKFFRVSKAKVVNGILRPAMQHSAHGFDAKKNVDLKKQLFDYCMQYAGFYIGIGETPETAEVTRLSPEEAYNWLLPRLQYSDTYGIRFAFGGYKGPTEKSIEKRYKRLRDEGYKI